MANGVSCAFFAARNIVNGTKEKNVFKEGIGVAQTIRTADAACMAAANAANGTSKAAAEAAILTVKNATSAAKVSPIANLLNKGAIIAKKLLYPLICLSAAYNTYKSKDKIKTGVSQSTAIATMFTFETLTQKHIIDNFEKSLDSVLKSNNKTANLWAVIRGIIFATASIIGYTTGSKIGEASVNLLRGKKSDKSDDNFVNNQNDNKENVFDEIELQ